MRQALDLAARGEGHVEPNPMVGCVLVVADRPVGQGYHAAFGGPHAEVTAIREAGERSRGATAYVTLEPCCHHGKTPPCTAALIQSGVTRVVIANEDPFPQVAGGGVAQLRAAGIQVDIGLLSDASRPLNAPYLKRVRTGRPWMIAKWAMTLDGKVATAGGDSRWISSERSRQIVHQLRGRMDGIMIGRGTAAADDPLLTARPAGPRTATRIVVDSQAQLSIDSQLVQTSGQAPTLIASGPAAEQDAVDRLTEAGCEIIRGVSDDSDDRLDELLVELGRRSMTNILVEGGPRLLASLIRAGQIDEVHVFLAPKLLGGGRAVSEGPGLAAVSDALDLVETRVEHHAGDTYWCGRIRDR